MEGNKPLLTIELDYIGSVPKVFYKGEEIKSKVRVAFEWETDSEVMELGSPYIDIEYCVNDPNERPHTKSIRYNGYFNQCQVKDKEQKDCCSVCGNEIEEIILRALDNNEVYSKEKHCIKCGWSNG